MADNTQKYTEQPYADDVFIAHMASSKAPRHDFAPAWLKIPEHGQKPTGTKSSEHGEKRNYHRGKDERHVFDYSFGGSKSRQQSLEEAYYENQAYYNYYNGYPGLSFRGAPSPYREMKYPPHTGRYMNGYPPYFDSGFGYDVYHSGGMGDRFSGNMGRPPVNNGRSRHKSDKESRKPVGERAAASSATTETGTGKKEEEEKSVNSVTGKDRPIEEEFPSLGGDMEVKGDSPADKNKPTGVWDKYSRVKILQTNKEPNVNGIKKADNCNRDIKQNNTHIYKALVPNKGKITKRSNKDNPKLGTPSKDINCNNSVFSRHNKENTVESPSTPPIDILNSCLVSQHKKPTDKKSDFLKALKQETHDFGSSGLSNKEHNRELHNGSVATGMHPVNGLTIGGVNCRSQGMVNGFEDLTLEAECGSGLATDESVGTEMLSSSLEAEQRLLREMGWSEDDEQNTISEEVMLEMEQLSKDLKQLKQQKTGLKRTLPKTWSPQHHGGLYSPCSPLAGQTLNTSNGGIACTLSTDSSSDSDSDTA